MYEAFEHLTDLYLSEFIVAILIISIIVVVMSIFHIVIVYIPTDGSNNY